MLPRTVPYRIVYRSILRCSSHAPSLFTAASRGAESCLPAAVAAPFSSSLTRHTLLPALSPTDDSAPHLPWRLIRYYAAMSQRSPSPNMLLSARPLDMMLLLLPLAPPPLAPRRGYAIYLCTYASAAFLRRRRNAPTCHHQVRDTSSNTRPLASCLFSPFSLLLHHTRRQKIPFEATVRLPQFGLAPRKATNGSGSKRS